MKKGLKYVQEKRHVSRAASLRNRTKVNSMGQHNRLDSMCGVSDEELTERFKKSIQIDNEIKRIKGLPVAKFDMEKKKAYIEYPDGRREYA